MTNRQTPVSATYSQANVESSEFFENNDCSVKAAAILLGRPYAEVHAAFSRCGRRHRQSTLPEVTQAAFRELGYRLTPMGLGSFRKQRDKPDWVEEILAGYPPCYRVVKRLTINQIRKFPKAWAHCPDLLVETRTHHAAFKDGVVHDWSVSRAMEITQLYMIKPL